MSLKIVLSDNWQFRQEGHSEWFPASVPGCVHTDLLNNGLVEEPFYRDNESKLQWIGKTDWHYKTTFQLDEKQISCENIELVFKGLDTYAVVRLNNVELLQTENMYREWRIDCKAHLKPNQNTLEVQFFSPIEKVLPDMEKRDFLLPTVSDLEEKTSPYTRKAPYHYGWDGGPRFVTSGIWRPVFLECWNTARFDDVYIIQKDIDEKKARLTARITCRSEKAQTVLLDVRVDSEEVSYREEHRLQKGESTLWIDFSIKNPEMWWPNGMGGQKLYDVRLRFSRDGDIVDIASIRTGLRTLELRRKKDRWGRSFEFVVNGIPVFCKGGNWIPADSFPSRMNGSRYESLLKSCLDANMNMVRVWGGGLYEEDVFYDHCDEMGILVWQDFMFSCSLYPADEVFLDSVKQEAIDNIRRLRNHPSIVIWCGNNEIEMGYFEKGWHSNLPDSVRSDYDRIFSTLLPEVCREMDPSRPYWPSSPSSDLAGDSTLESGDCHYWGVWHATEPFESYEKQFPRFMSEYGFQAFPPFQTVKRYTEENDRDIESAVMKAHQKHPDGNRLIRNYMLQYYAEPADFRSFLYVSQVLQAEAIKKGAEHLRRLKPRCMGSLYWQINDCWPVVSWSSIDYYGRWKALHYYARNFYNDVLLTFHDTGTKVDVYVVSDRLETQEATLCCQLLDFYGGILSEETGGVEIKANSSALVATFSRSDLLHSRDSTRILLNGWLQQDDKMLSKNCHYFEPFKSLNLPAANLKTSISESPRGLRFLMESENLAKNVFLEIDDANGQFSDNFFDLLPGEKKTVEYITDQKVDREKIKIVSLIEAFK